MPQRNVNAGVAGVVAGDTGNQSNKIINDSGAVVATDAGLQKKKNHPGGCGRPQCCTDAVMRQLLPLMPATKGRRIIQGGHPQCCTDASDAVVVSADACHQNKRIQGAVITQYCIDAGDAFVVAGDAGLQKNKII